MTIKRVLVIAALAAAGAAPAFAHGDEGGGGGTILPAGTTRVTLGYDFVHFDGISDETLTALAIQGVGEVHSLKTIGDLSVTGTYRFLHQEQAGFDASVILGVKAPTGKTGTVDNFGEVFETEHQPGSGSWDGMFGAALSKEMGAVTFSANGLYTVNGEGSRQTTLGDRLSYGAALSYRLWNGDGGHDRAMHLGGTFDGIMYHGGVDHGEADGHRHGRHDGHDDGVALDVSLGLNGDWQDKHETVGEREGNTGGHILYVTPGLKLSVEPWTGFLNVGIPVASNLNGIQAEPDWRLSTGISVDF